MKYRLVIFDFDGTLADTFGWFAHAINRIADKYHFKKVEPSEHDTIRGFDARAVLKYLGVPLWKTPLIAAHMRVLMSRDIHHIRLFAGVDNLLRRLSEVGATLAVVSSNSFENIRHVLGAEVAALIDYYECGVSAFGKEAKLRKVLRQSGIPRREAIYIGDEIRDSEAAREVGIAFGGATWGYTTPDALRVHAPSDVLARVDDILDRVIG
ncbi:MAG: HAD hydrolase-like protein [Sedimentisphaerales bacterium]|nr:HAD hydrolase-like protein [Sedimentisphaerales bacterium]NLZ07192.1 HAD hydrolase-like protein [Phycisphaerae bacterium]HNY80280.1 HAD hydrolase-like protein [Sedimentisphaerales bacterium]HOC65075.1 HAD hydrolase-like protein [Sedimentisphaerales bacterium]HOH66040.1 HAD hydrolase-like protein [Sedimentisphaerales bacterium]